MVGAPQPMCQSVATALATVTAGRVPADDAAHERAGERLHLLGQRGQQSVLGRRHDPVRAGIVSHIACRHKAAFDTMERSTLII